MRGVVATFLLCIALALVGFAQEVEDPAGSGPISFVPIEIDPLGTSSGVVSGDDHPSISAQEAAIVRAISASDTEALQAILAGPECAAGGCLALIDQIPVMHMAARLSDFATIQILLQAGAEINIPHPQTGWTPLMEALKRGEPEIVKLLVTSGANTDVSSTDGLHAGTLAQLVGLEDIVPPPPLELSQQDADVLLLRAVEAGSQEIVAEALRAGASPHAKASNGWSAAMLAAFHGQTDILTQLTDSDLGVLHYTEPQGGYGVAHAAVIGNAEPSRWQLMAAIITRLKDHAVDLTQTSHTGFSPAAIARNQGVDAGLIDQIFGTVATSGTSVPIEAPQPVTNLPLSEARYVFVNAKVLNMRGGPSTDYEVIDQLGRGALVRRLDDPPNGSWIKVDSVLSANDEGTRSGLVGWVNATHLSPTKPADSVWFGELCVQKTKPWAIQPGRARERRNAAAHGGFVKCDSHLRATTGQCIAMAHDGADTASAHNMAWGVWDSRAEAEVKVIERCNNVSGTSCRLRYLDCLQSDHIDVIE